MPSQPSLHPALYPTPDPSLGHQPSPDLFDTYAKPGKQTGIRTDPARKDEATLIKLNKEISKLKRKRRSALEEMAELGEVVEERDEKLGRAGPAKAKLERRVAKRGKIVVGKVEEGSAGGVRVKVKVKEEEVGVKVKDEPV